MTRLYGTNESDLLKDSRGDDSLFGFAGDDTLVSGRGDDTLSGGSGSDTVLLSGPRANYTISTRAGSLVVTDNVGRDGEDTLISIATLQFNDETIDVEGLNSSIGLGGFNGGNGFRLDGQNTGDSAGFEVAGAGDFNGDGVDDIVVAAINADPGGLNSGAAYVVFGSVDGFQPVLNLADLDGTDGFKVEGLAAGDFLGRAVAGIGDINGDGLDDLLIGASAIDDGGENAGGAYVLFGTTASMGAVFDPSTLDGGNGFRLDGESASDSAGFAASAAGDVNGDGTDDLLIGAPSANYNGAASGSSYVVFGNTNGFSAAFNLGSVDGTNGFRLDGPTFSDSGSNVSHAGDVNNDGIDDIIVGIQLDDPSGVSNAGSAAVVFGSGAGLPASFDLATLDGTNGFFINGEGVADNAGRSVDAAGDINGDGVDDLIVGAWNADVNGLDSGAAYVVFGSGSAFGAAVNLAELTGANGFRLEGEAPGDKAGFSASGAGDINGDGIDDLLVGAQGTQADGPLTGTTYVVYGSNQGFDASINLGDISGAAGFRLEGQAGGDYAGWDVNDLGDVDGDGTPDFIVGAFGAGNNGAFSGSAYVILGGGGIPGNSELTGGVTISGSAVIGGTVTAVDSIDDPDGKGLVSYQWLADGSPIAGATGQSFTITQAYRLDRLAVVASYTDGRGNLESVISDPTLPAISANFLFQLSELDGKNGFQINGVGLTDRYGWTVSGAGDVNADGFADLLVGGPFDDPNGSASGAAYLVLGSSDDYETPIDLGELDGTTGFGLFGEDSGDFAGWDVSSAGDVNGDDIDDFIVGASAADPVVEETSTGASYVVFGRPGIIPSSIELASLDGTDGFRIDGVASGDLSGEAVSAAGDVNGDGIDDLLIGSRGADPNGLNSGTAYVVFGQGDGFAATLDLGNLDGSNGFQLNGKETNDNAGFALSSAGDLNGDGFNDIAIGAFAANQNGGNSGVVYVVYGSADGFGQTIELDQLNGDNGTRLVGGDNGYQVGISVSGAGDFNGDGTDDLLIGADGTDFNGDNSGSAYLVYGTADGFGATLNLNNLDGSNGIRLDGDGAGDRLGRAVSGVGDFNNDGKSDILVGSPFAQPNGEGSGSVSLIFGTHSLLAPHYSLSNLIGDYGFRVDGEFPDDNLGYSVSGADDVNGDGFDDIVIGAQGADPNGSLSGAAYVLLGRPDNSEPSGLVSISGVAAEGETLSVFENIVDPDGNGIISWQWVADREPIEGAMSTTYTLTSDEVGREVTAVASYVDGRGWQEAVISEPTEPVSGEQIIISLADLNGQTGFQLSGGAAGDSAGRSVSFAGDVNGDGFDDLVLSAWQADANGPDAGASYVYFGKEDGFSNRVELADLNGSDGFIFEGVATGDKFGASVSGAGDFNGDGYDDIVIGAENADPNGQDSGSVFVVFGAAGGFEQLFDPADLDGANGFRLDGGTIGDSAGISVSSAGDFNLDGYADLVVGAHWADPGGDQSGEAYVLFGRAGGFAATKDLTDLDGTDGFRIPGVAISNALGHSVSTAGDVNGDGLDDVIVGAYLADVNGQDAGASYVVFGQAGTLEPAFDLQSLDGSNGFRLIGSEGDQAGRAVSNAGDINGDGYGDLIVGAPGASPGGESSGSAYVVLGRASGFTGSLDLASLDGDDGFRLDGVAAFDVTGRSAGSAGDINGDGYDDLIVGAFGGDNASIDSGSSYVIFGSAAGFRPVIDLALLGPGLGFRIDGAFMGDQSGSSVSGAGDINSDGWDDLVIGAHQASPNGDSSGAAYVLFGTDDFSQLQPSGLLVEGDAGDSVLNGGPNDDTLIGYAGRDILRGFAGDDQLDGGAGIDQAVFQGDRSDYIVLHSSGQLEVTGPTADGSDTLVQIERLRFNDISVAYDLDGNAGLAVKLLGVALGSVGSTDTVLRGIALDIFDNAGLSFEQVMDIALDAVLAGDRSDAAVVNLLWQNLVGGTTPQDLLDDLVGGLAGGAFTQAGLAVLAAETDINQTNIDLIGLTENGADYLALS